MSPPKTLGFFGLYTSIEWRPLDRLRIDAGIAMNVTHETQSTTTRAQAPAASEPPHEVEARRQRRIHRNRLEEESRFVNL